MNPSDPPLTAPSVFRLVVEVAVIAVGFHGAYCGSSSVLGTSMTALALLLSTSAQRAVRGRTALKIVVVLLLAVLTIHSLTGKNETMERFLHHPGLLIPIWALLTTLTIVHWRQVRQVARTASSRLEVSIGPQ